MNNARIILGTFATTLLAGCVSVPVTLAPVGPNPVLRPTDASTGQLEVFSALEDRTEGSNDEFDWPQHADYTVWSQRGTLVKRVENTVGHYAEEPRVITLPVGSYIVQGRAKDFWLVEVPVVIAGGETTKVHLDDNWTVPGGLPESEFVYTPNGFPVGWSTKPGSQYK
jgi:hypothetical protein